jgi:4a-hydroxytetrahydrobiopterin dehydratase
MSIARLTDAERDEALAPGWALREDGLAIIRTFRFADFAEAFGFMARVAIHAERRITTPNGSTCTTAWTSR